MKFTNGNLVRVYNHEHIWHGEIGIVRDSKPTGFYRIELLGILTWMPEHWLLMVEDNESDEHCR